MFLATGKKKRNLKLKKNDAKEKKILYKAGQRLGIIVFQQDFNRNNYDEGHQLTCIEVVCLKKCVDE